MSEREKDLFPLVSIITPAYNRADYLAETIDSVLEQDYPRIEYIVLDDGSTDNTREVLSKYAGRIIWESHPNMGETRTVNKGIEMAHGEIVAIVNSDDPLLPGAVRIAAEFLRNRPEVLVAYPDWDYIDGASQVVQHVQVPEYDYSHMLRRHHCIVGPGAFVRKEVFELIGGRDPEFRYVADFDFWLRAGLHGTFARISKTLATFRVHPTSASIACQGEAMAAEHVRLVKKLFRSPAMPQEATALRREAFAWAHYVAGASCGSNHKAARRHYLLAMYYYPRGVFEEWKSVVSLVLPRPLFRPLQIGWRIARRARAVALRRRRPT